MNDTHITNASHSSKWLTYLPWSLTLLFLAVSLFFGLVFRPPSPLAQHQTKTRLLADMQIALLQALEAEKNALLAHDEGQAQSFASQSRQATAELEKQRSRWEKLSPKSPEEQSLSAEFAQCWTKLRALDETLLPLVTQQTNLKASKLSDGQATAALAALESSLQGLNRPEVLIAALKIQTLHKPHIAAAEDAGMSQFETSIQVQEQLARKSLATLPPGTGREQARKALEHYLQLSREVLRLSRLNTNIRSVALSLDTKRLIFSHCQQQLTRLEQVVAAQASTATR